MFEDLIDYEQLHEACEEMFGFGTVTFKRDFGPWKQGDRVEILWFHLETGVVEEQDKQGVVKTAKFKLEPAI